MDKIGEILTAWQIWVIAGIVLCILEIFAPGFFLMSLGVGCFIAAVSALIFGLKGQIALFIIGSTVAFFLARKFIYYKKDQEGEEFGAKSMIGREGYVQEKVTDREGYVKIGGERWPARSATGEEFEPETKVIIQRLEGNKVYVTGAKKQ